MKKIVAWIKAEMDTWEGVEWMVVGVCVVAAPFAIAIMLLS